MSGPGTKVFESMLERLFAAIISGPAMNCRPHNSRQRLDLTALRRLGAVDPSRLLCEVLGEAAEAKAEASHAAPQGSGPARSGRSGRGASPSEVEESDEARAARTAWSEQQSLMTKLRVLAEEARTYADDTGVHALFIGFPLLSLPPGVGSRSSVPGTRRILAPIALIPVQLEIKSGAAQSVRLACRHDDAERVQPNEALLAWIEQQTGQSAGELFADVEGAETWRELSDLVGFVCRAMKIEPTGVFGGDPSAGLELQETPRTEQIEARAQVLTSAVLGLFPLANQGLLRDTKELLNSGPGEGPLARFVVAGAGIERLSAKVEVAAAAAEGEQARTERLVSHCDPCQTRAVRYARTCEALVVHGPPGTGKSQTITNIIGDHLSRGERVLFVCDKRTALDVVANRLRAVGLGELCAVVHDPQRDRRSLYLSVREQLDGLAATKADGDARRELDKLDTELNELHAQLAACHNGLNGRPAGGGPALHELVGQWLATGPTAGPLRPSTDPAVRELTLGHVEKAELAATEVLRRAGDCRYYENPWATAAGVALGAWLARPTDDWRAALETCRGPAERADALHDAGLPPLTLAQKLGDQAADRDELAGALQAIAEVHDVELRRHWAAKAGTAIAAAQTELTDLAPLAEVLEKTAADPELLAAVRGVAPALAQVNQQLGVVEAYLPIAGKWWAVLAFGRRGACAKVAAAYGLPLSVKSTTRLRSFLAGLRAAMVLAESLNRLSGRPAPAGVPDRAGVLELWRSVGALVRAADAPRRMPGLAPFAAYIAEAIGGGRDAAVAATAVANAAERARLIVELAGAAERSGLFAAAWLDERRASWPTEARIHPQIASLAGRLESVDDIVRINERLGESPAGIAVLLRQVLASECTVEEGLLRLRRGVLAAQITRRLDEDPQLRSMDAKRLEGMFDRYRELVSRRIAVSREVIQGAWLARQRERLLVSTGSRLSTLGASVRQRLLVAGPKALRLRQVVGLGEGIEGGDPLLDLRPVWMASPETVAMVFPRRDVFDVVIFDEASQCRLEEALPVLTRAKRVVIAGDPKQLPPTRFFESGVAQSEAQEIASEQDLFESQTSDVEDLLAASLNLDLQQCYLDVHYRSRNSDLIAFSNEQFYSARLQAIPGHPKNRAKFPPLTVYHAGGVYQERSNRAEAERVVGIVKDLLRRAEPPSIAIACFNITQRDVISEALDEAGLADAEFGARLAEARRLVRDGAFEGLFVKNLENVQGDERDHVIISTTYGPDPEGRFYRRFGPLGQPGGGRRLNVLITRARREVHIVTSIPADVYRSIPPIPAEQTPTGGWLLLSYIHFAEKLAALYDDSNPDAGAGEGAAEIVPPGAESMVMRSAAPSRVAEQIGGHLAAGLGIGNTVHWGNDGFCVDVALHHPIRPEDVTVGVVCDLVRFTPGCDPIDWEVFRTDILRGQGWELHRLWTPALVRDPRGNIDPIVKRAEAVARQSDDPDAMRVVR